MGTLNFLRVGLLALGVSSVIAYSAPVSSSANSRCSLSQEQLIPKAEESLNQAKKEGRDFTFDLKQSYVETKPSPEHPGTNYANTIAEGFVHPPTGYYRLVPGLGMGVEIKHNTLMYICLDVTQSRENSRMVVYFFEATGMNRKGLFGDRFHKKPTVKPVKVSVQLRPIGEIFHAARSLPYIGKFFPKAIEDVVTDVGNVFYAGVNKVIKQGVSQLEVAPKEIKFTTSTELLGVSANNANMGHPLDSSWLTKDYPDAKLTNDAEEKSDDWSVFLEH